MRRTFAVLLLSAALLPAKGFAQGPSASAGRQWSLLPRSQPTVPRFDDPAGRAWVRNALDAFVLTRLREEGLRPAPEADRPALLRRLTYDFTGLPPTPAEIDAFTRDPASDAYERLVERLLASPQYGERWGRHWLDVVRYAETEGFEYDRHRPGAWRYRDYVIHSLNADKPFDRFVREQIAGDEIGPNDRDLQAAAGFHRLGPVRRNAGNAQVAFSRNEVLTEMTDSLGAVFLGLTVGCARCHDHKFDPIGQADYYGLQAFLAATQEHDVVLASPVAQATWKARTKAVQAEMKRFKEALKRAEGEAERRLLDQLKEAERRLPPPLPTVSSVRNVAAERTPIHLLKRGDPDKKGPAVGMRVLAVLADERTPELPPDAANPRTALARWLTNPDHPLTARVLVNRVWQYHFGRGLVETANDFGANGAAPSHPELLDHLANAFVADGWRLKPLHRLIVLSSTYRQASRPADAVASQEYDPDNRLLGHFARRRLTAEEIRDSLLALAGRLNPKAGGPSVIPPVERDLVHLLYDPAQWAVTPDRAEYDRRSVYLIAKRNLRLPFVEVFDQPDLQTSCARRESSTHAPQALELLNGATSNRLAEAFAERLEREAGSDRARQVVLAYRLAAGRAPTWREQALAVAFLEKQPLREFAIAVFNLNAFLYVD
jgi:hypothetical protein